MMINTIDITISGYVNNCKKLPNGKLHFNNFGWWQSYDVPIIKTLNLANVETFEPIQFPLVSFNIIKKKLSFFQRLMLCMFGHVLDDIEYDVKVVKVGIKNVTLVKMRSGEKIIVDETTDVLKNALDSCVWTYDFLKQLER